MIETTEKAPGIQPEIESFAVDCGNIPVSATVSRFRGGSGVSEYHLAIRPRDGGDMETHLDWVLEGYLSALDALGLDSGSAVLRRFFCSDLVNQRDTLEARLLSNPRNTSDPCAVSWIGQPPAPPVKVALWAYHVEDPAAVLEKTLCGSTLTLRRGELAHLWTAGLTCPAETSAYGQTRAVLDAYEVCLRERNLTLMDHAVRTWLFVRDIDADYGMLVKARRELFAERGLTADTHFIASTGVEGSHVDAGTKVALDAYAIAGLQAAQVEYLSAPEHLSPTQIYGVTFERGVSVAYRDRKHIIISGTASIDSEGKIVHPGNMSRQFDRAVENLEALMRVAGAGLRDFCALTVYIRDPSDHALAWQRMRECFGSVPVQVVVAPVCRPGWLIELEGMAAVPASHPELPEF